MNPTMNPTKDPTMNPTKDPTKNPTVGPSMPPTEPTTFFITFNVQLASLTNQDKTALCTAAIDAVEATVGDNSVATCTVVAGVLVTTSSDGVEQPATTLVLLTFTEDSEANGQCDIVSAEEAIRENLVEATISTGTTISSLVYNPVWGRHGGGKKTMGRAKNKKPKCKKHGGNKHNQQGQNSMGMGASMGASMGVERPAHHSKGPKSKGKKSSHGGGSMGMGAGMEGPAHHIVSSKGKKQSMGKKFDKVSHKGNNPMQGKSDKGTKLGSKQPRKRASVGKDIVRSGNTFGTIAVVAVVAVAMVFVAAGVMYAKMGRTQPVNERTGNVSPGSEIESTKSGIDRPQITGSACGTEEGQLAEDPMFWGTHMQNMSQREIVPSQGEYIFTTDAECIDPATRQAKV